MYHIVKSGMFLWKWLYCSWRHHRDKCYSRVDIPEGEPGANSWHCAKCHPCGEGFDLILGYRIDWDKNDNEVKLPLNWRQQLIHARWEKKRKQPNSQH